MGGTGCAFGWLAHYRVFQFSPVTQCNVLHVIRIQTKNPSFLFAHIFNIVSNEQRFFYTIKNIIVQILYWKENLIIFRRIIRIFKIVLCEIFDWHFNLTVSKPKTLCIFIVIQERPGQSYFWAKNEFVYIVNPRIQLLLFS